MPRLRWKSPKRRTPSNVARPASPTAHRVDTPGWRVLLGDRLDRRRLMAVQLLALVAALVWVAMARSAANC